MAAELGKDHKPFGYIGCMRASSEYMRGKNFRPAFPRTSVERFVDTPAFP